MATELERLTVVIEANTRQFTRAIQALDRETQTGMRAVERSIAQSAVRAGETFNREFLKGLGIARGGLAGLAGAMLGNFVQDSVSVAADAGSASAQVFLNTWSEAIQQLKTTVGSVIADIAIALGTEEQQTQVETIEKRKQVELRRTTEAIKDQYLTYQTVNAAVKQSRLDIPAAIPDVKLPSIPRVSAAPRAVEAPDLTLGAQREIKALIDELNVLGKTNEQKAIYNALSAAAVGANTEMGQSIVGLVTQLEHEKEQLAAVKEINDSLEESAKTFAQTLLEGESAVDALNAALRRLADALLNMAFQTAFNPGGVPLLGRVLGGASAAPAAAATSAGITVNVQGSVDQQTLAVMDRRLAAAQAKQMSLLQRNWGGMTSRYQSLRGP